MVILSVEMGHADLVISRVIQLFNHLIESRESTTIGNMRVAYASLRSLPNSQLMYCGASASELGSQLPFHQVSIQHL